MAFLDNTFKNYYYPEKDDEPSDEEGTVGYKVKNSITKRKNDIEDFFEKPKKKKLQKKSSTVGRSSNGGVAYISSNKEDGANASHLIKIEIYDMKKIKDIPPLELWKHAEVRVKYYSADEADKHIQNVRDVVFNITKQLVSRDDCAKYFIETDK